MDNDPFDARRVMLNDEDQPALTRRTVSLVTALRAALLESTAGTAAKDPRVQDLERIVDELTNRGLDGDSLIRYGLHPELIAGVIGHGLASLMPRVRELPDASTIEASSAEAETPEQGFPTTWADLLGSVTQIEMPPSDTLTPEMLAPLFERITRNVTPWLLAAPLIDLLTLRPPTPEQLQNAISSSAPDPATLLEYRWVIDRFAITHLHEWSTPSLHSEYRWRQGTHPPPCADTLMDDRVVTERELNDEIARRAVTEESPILLGGPDGLSLALLAKLNSSAVDFLRTNRPGEAAALFEFALTAAPNDAQLVNNLGFCLIPQDPRRALIELEKANSLGFLNTEVNLHNRALCRLQLGEYRTTLTMVQDQWDKLRGDQAFLWRPMPSGLELQSGADTRDELAYLAYLAATFLGESEVSERWSRRAHVEDGSD